MGLRPVTQNWIFEDSSWEDGNPANTQFWIECHIISWNFDAENKILMLQHLLDSTRKLCCEESAKRHQLLSERSESTETSCDFTWPLYIGPKSDNLYVRWRSLSFFLSFFLSLFIYLFLLPGLNSTCHSVCVKSKTKIFPTTDGFVRKPFQSLFDHVNIATIREKLTETRAAQTQKV